MAAPFPTKPPNEATNGTPRTPRRLGKRGILTSGCAPQKVRPPLS